jgi:hypothetical protein
VQDDPCAALEMREIAVELAEQPDAVVETAQAHSRFGLRLRQLLTHVLDHQPPGCVGSLRSPAHGPMTALAMIAYARPSGVAN